MAKGSVVDLDLLSKKDLAQLRKMTLQGLPNWPEIAINWGFQGQCLPNNRSRSFFAPLMRSTDSFQGRQTQSQMLSFASPRSHVKVGGGQSLSWSCYQQSPALVYSRNACYNASGSMPGSFAGIRGPFTPAQWIELEHQALIYKYFTANVPVPATLLVPIRKAFNHSGFPAVPAHSYGWGPFQLGYTGSTDP